MKKQHKHDESSPFDYTKDNTSGHQECGGWVARMKWNETTMHTARFVQAVCISAAKFLMKHYCSYENSKSWAEAGKWEVVAWRNVQPEYFLPRRVSWAMDRSSLALRSSSASAVRPNNYEGANGDCQQRECATSAFPHCECMLQYMWTSSRSPWLLID